MDNSILVSESGVTDAKTLRSQGAKPVSGQESEDFCEVLDDQLLKGEAQALENNVPVVAQPPPVAPQIPVEPVVNPLESSVESLVNLTVNSVDVAGLSQTTAGLPIAQTTTAGPAIVPVTGTPAEILQASSTAAKQPAFEVNPGSVTGVARVVAGSVAPAAVAAGQSAVMNGNGADADTGAVSLPVAASNQPTSSQTAAVSAAGVRGAGSTHEVARPQAEILAALGGKFEPSEQSLSSTQQITAIEAGQSLAERRSGPMSTTLPTPPIPAMAPATQILTPSMPTAVLAPVVPQALPALAQPLGDGQWNNSFGQRIAWAVGQGVQSASLAMNPEELGPVTVQIAVRDDEASLRFNAAHGLTRDAIEAALPRLREMLQAGGLSLGQVDISADAQARAGQQDTQQPGHGPATNSNRQVEDESTLATPVVQYTSRGLVDTFV